MPRYLLFLVLTLPVVAGTVTNCTITEKSTGNIVASQTVNGLFFGSVCPFLGSNAGRVDEQLFTTFQPNHLFANLFVGAFPQILPGYDTNVTISLRESVLGPSLLITGGVGNGTLQTFVSSNGSADMGCCSAGVDLFVGSTGFGADSGLGHGVGGPPIPFTFGIPIQLSVAIQGNANVSNFVGGAGTASVSILFGQILDSSGQPVPDAVITIVPETNSTIQIIIGLLIYQAVRLWMPRKPAAREPVRG